MIKKGLNLILPVNFKDLDFSKVEKIEFIFRQDKNFYSNNFKISIYDNTEESECILRPNTTIVEVPWSKEDTYKFNSSSNIMYMDTRITYLDSDYSPITEIISFPFKQTMFDQIDLESE